MTEAERTVKSLATMLGWSNTPPRESLEATVRALIKRIEAVISDNIKLREALWIRHGCPFAARYGDDAEMQCNNNGCMIDFKRDPIKNILAKWQEQNLAELAKVKEA